MADPGRVVSQNYLITFYKDVESLRHWTALFFNSALELSAKYGDNPEATAIEPADKEGYANIVRNVRYYCNLAYGQLKAILKSKGEKADEKLEGLFGKITKVYALERDVIFEFNELISVKQIELCSCLTESTDDLLAGLAK